MSSTATQKQNKNIENIRPRTAYKDRLGWKMVRDSTESFGYYARKQQGSRSESMGYVVFSGKKRQELRPEHVMRATLWSKASCIWRGGFGRPGLNIS